MVTSNPFDAYRKAAAMNKSPIKGLVAPESVKAGGDALPDHVQTEEKLKQTQQANDVEEKDHDGLLEEPVQSGQFIDTSKPIFVPVYQQKDPEQEPEKALNPYFVNSVMTASPEKLTLMLYDGALRFMHEAARFIDERNHEKSHNSNMKAQKIIVELMSTLDMSYEVAGSMMPLYEYIHYNLIQANIKKDKEPLNIAINLTQEFRNTWAEAMKIAAAEKEGAEANVKMDIQTAVK